MQDKAGKASGSARNLLQDSAVMMLEAESMTPNKASRKGKRKNQKPQQSMGDRLKKTFHRSGEQVAPKKPSAGPYPKTGQRPPLNRCQPKATSQIATKAIL